MFHRCRLVEPFALVVVLLLPAVSCSKGGSGVDESALLVAHAQARTRALASGTAQRLAQEVRRLRSKESLYRQNARQRLRRAPRIKWDITGGMGNFMGARAEEGRANDFAAKRHQVEAKLANYVDSEIMSALGQERYELVQKVQAKRAADAASGARRVAEAAAKRRRDEPVRRPTSRPTGK